MTKNFILGTMNLFFKAIFLILAVFLIVYGAKRAFSTGYNLIAESNSSDEMVVNVDINIPQGTSTEGIANILKENKLIGNPLYFRILAKISGYDGMFQYGDYTFSTSMDEDEIMKILLTEGEKKETVSFTIPEGYTVVQIADKLDSEGICESDEFLAAVDAANYGYKFISLIPERNIKLQGYLFPNTYEVYKDATAQDIVSTMLKEFDTIFTQEFYDRAAVLGYEVDEIITIASIIEREVKLDSERKSVAGVIYNRLEQGMKLEMCSTVMYALNKTKDRLLYKDLEIDSPYNTYLYPNLPLGPIANPGLASIEAALYPEDNDYLFFVLVDEESGAHEFNTTLEAHNAAKEEHGEEF